MRNGTHAEVAAVDGLLDEAVRRGLALRLDSVDQVLMAAAWFLHRWPGENLAVKIREVLTPRPGGYVLTLVPAGELLPPGKVLVFRATAEVNGRSTPVGNVVVSSRRAGPSSSSGSARADCETLCQNAPREGGRR